MVVPACRAHCRDFIGTLRLAHPGVCVRVCVRDGETEQEEGKLSHMGIHERQAERREKAGFH